MSGAKIEKKWEPHEPIKPRDPIPAENGNYNPCPLEYNTFTGYEMHKDPSHQTLSKK
jgi:hypothetical protein